MDGDEAERQRQSEALKTFRRVGLAGFIALILLLVGVALLLFFGVKIGDRAFSRLS
jgi:hypothetical protein